MKLKEITTIWGGSTPATKNKELWLNEIPFITPNFISKNKINIVNNSDRFVTDKNLNFSKKNDILVTCRAPVGIVAINNLEKCWFSQGIKNIKTGKLINFKYLYYWFFKNKNMLITNSIGTTFLEISKYSLENLEINLISLDKQQRIIAIIEPFENLQTICNLLIKQITKMLFLISNSYSLPTNQKLTKYFNFIKGIEIPDLKRTNFQKNEFVRYIRVADLSATNERQPLYCFLENKKFLCDYQDILIATDGVPGRIKTGLNGIFSSSIRKVEAKNQKEIVVALLNLFNKENKELFNAYTTGTTIKHGGSNAIKHLKYFGYNENIEIISKYLFAEIILLQIIMLKINKIKNDLINKLIK